MAKLRILYKFEIPGQPHGYTTTTYRDKGRSDRYKKYKKYCQDVRHFASMAGVPIPLMASESEPLRISIRAFFANGNHCDVENTRKGIVDALFYDSIAKKKGNDKWVDGCFSLPRYDKSNPRVEVIIKEFKK